MAKSNRARKETYQTEICAETFEVLMLSSFGFGKQFKSLKQDQNLEPFFASVPFFPSPSL